MPVYQYTALTPAGKTTKGVVDANTARDARLKLRADKVHVTDMKEVAQAGKGKKLAKTGETKSIASSLDLRSIRFERSVNVRDLAAFTRQFATLLKSGIQLAEAMRAMVEQCTDRDLEKVLRAIKEDITGGASLAESLARHPRYFNDLYVNMVKAGEASGTLDEVLGRIADYLQKQASLRGKVSSALTYPAIMVFVGTAVVIFLMSFVVPRITQVLEQRGGELPWITQFLMSVSDVFQNLSLIHI